MRIDLSYRMQQLAPIFAAVACFSLGGVGATAICGSLVWPVHHLTPAVYLAAAGFAVAWMARSCRKTACTVGELLGAVGVATLLLVAATAIRAAAAGGSAPIRPSAYWPPYVQPMSLTLVTASAGSFWSLWAPRSASARGYRSLRVLGAIWRWVLVLVAGCSLGAATGLAEGLSIDSGSEIVLLGGIVLGVLIGAVAIPVVYRVLRASEASGPLASYTALATVTFGVLNVKVLEIYSFAITPLAAVLLAACLARSFPPAGHQTAASARLVN